jgi:N-acetylmuramoyl-L-alanine amidase
MVQHVVVIDPGHGGTTAIGGSSANNATTPSGVLEKDMTLRMGLLVREKLAATGRRDVSVVMTRDTDRNVGLSERAHVARDHRARVFLSIHFNASEGHNARGVETLVRPRAAGNTNHAEDQAFARRIQRAAFNAIKAHDPGTRDRGVKDQVLGVLKDQHLGPGVAACLLEVEFIDVPEVDALLNINANAAEVLSDIAESIARAIMDQIDA